MHEHFHSVETVFTWLRTLFNLNLHLPSAIILVKLRANLSSFPIY